MMRTVSIASAAYELGLTQKALPAKLRELKWINPDNQPYRNIRLLGYMGQKQNFRRHPEGYWVPLPRKTPLLTRAGITELKRILSTAEVA